MASAKLIQVNDLRNQPGNACPESFDGLSSADWFFSNQREYAGHWLARGFGRPARHGPTMTNGCGRCKCLVALLRRTNAPLPLEAIDPWGLGGAHSCRPQGSQLACIAIKCFAWHAIAYEDEGRVGKAGARTAKSGYRHPCGNKSLPAPHPGLVTLSVAATQPARL